MFATFQKGIIHLGVLVLVVFGLVAATAVGILASNNNSNDGNRSLSTRLICISNPTSSKCKPIGPPVVLEPKPISPKGPCYPYGDVDGNGKVEDADAVAILQHVAGIKPLGKDFQKVADVNKDGKVDSIDAQLIKQYLSGKLTTFPACPPAISSVKPVPFRVRSGQLVDVYGANFGSNKGKVIFEYTTIPNQGVYFCQFEKSTVWTNSYIGCSSPFWSRDNRTMKVSVLSSDGRVSSPYSVWTGEATQSATPSSSLR